MKFFLGLTLFSCISSAWGSDSCKGLCGDMFDQDKDCQCNYACLHYNDCCDDYEEECLTEGVTDDDLIEFSEKLAANHQVKFTAFVQLNYQAHVNIGASDESENELLSVPDFGLVVSTHPTVKALISLFDNYISDVREAEDRTEEEIQEENNFVDAVMETAVLQETYEFLNKKNVFSGTYDQFGEFLKEIWFDLVDKDGTDQTVLTSCGFEHVFVGEVKGGEVGGQHNWIRFYLLEQAKQINYHGYISHLEFSDFAKEITSVYDWNGVMKKIGGGFVGTTPEFEFAIYTLCYMTRGIDAEDCILSFYDQRINVVTFPLAYNGKEHIRTAYPVEI